MIGEVPATDRDADTTSPLPDASAVLWPTTITNPRPGVKTTRQRTSPKGAEAVTARCSRLTASETHGTRAKSSLRKLSTGRSARKTALQARRAAKPRASAAAFQPHQPHQTPQATTAASRRMTRRRRIVGILPLPAAEARPGGCLNPSRPSSSADCQRRGVQLFDGQSCSGQQMPLTL